MERQTCYSPDLIPDHDAGMNLSRFRSQIQESSFLFSFGEREGCIYLAADVRNAHPSGKIVQGDPLPSPAGCLPLPTHLLFLYDWSIGEVRAR
jgi:hypothetical protein